MPPIKTRAALKQELSSTVSPGEETSFLASAVSSLEESRRHLQALREERAAIQRQVSIRARKRQDWKGKIPRPSGDPSRSEAIAELKRCSDAWCHRVASIRVRDGCWQLGFCDEFKAALSGLEGFAKIWIVAVAPKGLEFPAGKCCTGEGSRDVYLWLADVEAVDVKGGVVKIAGMNFEVSGNALEEVLILDVKPYVPYCDAWPSEVKE